MTKLTRDILIKRVFSDPKNYPYGFSRSGDFSISESKALGEYGCLIAALVDGQIEPQTEDDHRFLQTAFGQQDPQSPAEKAWVKYQKRINRPKMASIYGGKPAEVADDDDTHGVDSDIEISVDD